MKKRLLFLLLLAIGLPVSTAQAEPKLDPKAILGCISMGMYTSSNIKNKQVEVSTTFDHVLRFQAINKLDHNALKPFLDQGYKVILNIEFFDKKPNLDEIIAGEYDAQLRAFGKAAAADGREIWLRPLHEGNGDWYNWGVFYDPSHSTESYRAAFQHVVKVLRETGGKFKFQLNINRKNGKNKQTPLKEFYPGDSYVDMVTITNYNRAYTTKQHQRWLQFRDDFDNAYEQVSAMTGRPIGIAEMSSTSYGGDKPAWIREAFKDIAERYPRVIEVTWFAYNRPINGMIWDWDLNTPAERQAFAEGVAKLRTYKTCQLRLGAAQ